MDLDQGVRLTIVLVLFVVSSISNASVGAVMYRFKNLRTVPNLLILNSCIADVLNQIFNVPGFAGGYIIRDEEYFVGKTLALAISTLQLFFILVNLMAMTLLMFDRLCAFKFGIPYRVWRTQSKAVKMIAGKWITCLVISMVLLVPIWDVDLGAEPTYKYRRVHFSKRGYLAAIIIFPLFVVNNAVIAIATCSVIRHKNKVHAKEMGLNARESALDQIRKINEINAIKTIGVTVMVFFISYLPAIVYGIMNRMGVISTNEACCFGFLAYSCLFLAGLLNPFIYAIRTRRFRRALKSFLKDPLGSSEVAGFSRDGI